VSNFLSEDGVIVLAGEPFAMESLPSQFHQWTQWGMRTDPLSAYCIRKYGWFETGWTLNFMDQCFARIGFETEAFPHLGLDGGIIQVAKRKGSQRVLNHSLLPPSRDEEINTLRKQIEEYERQLSTLENSKSLRNQRFINKIWPFSK
jgi:hypothetical protein